MHTLKVLPHWTLCYVPTGMFVQLGLERGVPADYAGKYMLISDLSALSDLMDFTD
jgi:hypothetical protein